MNGHSAAVLRDHVREYAYDLRRTARRSDSRLEPWTVYVDRAFVLSGLSADRDEIGWPEDLETQMRRKA